MADGLNSDYDLDFIDDCISCEPSDDCCDESCEGRIWVAPCGSIDYTTGEIVDFNAFCEPKNITAMSHGDNAPIREKQYRGCKKSRKRGQPDIQFSLTWDICQGDAGQAHLLDRCAFDYVIAPKGNNLNFEANPSIFDQTTYVIWGRAIGDTYTWEYPDDDCQNTNRTFMTDRRCWATKVESQI